MTLPLDSSRLASQGSDIVSLSSLCAAPWRTGAAVIAWLQRGYVARLIPSALYRFAFFDARGRIRVKKNLVRKNHITDHVNLNDVGNRPANARERRRTAPEVRGVTGVSEVSSTYSRPRRGGSPHRTAHAHLCAAVSGCRRVVFGYVRVLVTLSLPDP